MLINILLAGFLGGITRGLVGFIKHQFAYRKVPFNFPYFISMSALSGIIGMSSALVVSSLGFKFEGFFSPALSFVVGYAGGDFIENIYKIIIKKSSWSLEDQKSRKTNNKSNYGKNT